LAIFYLQSDSVVIQIQSVAVQTNGLAGIRDSGAPFGQKKDLSGNSGKVQVWFYLVLRHLGHPCRPLWISLKGDVSQSDFEAI
jgi:hypothetical protein